MASYQSQHNLPFAVELKKYGENENHKIQKAFEHGHCKNISGQNLVEIYLHDCPKYYVHQSSKQR
jgi:hypothetical protein